MTKAVARDPIYRRRRFQSELIELCVRWYLTCRLSYRDLVEMMAVRGVTVSHSTILRWVQRYVPEFEKRWDRYARRVHSSWRMDELRFRCGAVLTTSTGLSTSTARPSIPWCARIAASRLP
jgi:transposase-like protein